MKSDTGHDDILTSPEYCGKILRGNYTQALKKRIAETYTTFNAFDKSGTPVISYIAAWNENENRIWYEFAGRKLTRLFKCKPEEAADNMRMSVIEHKIYKYFDFDIKEEITDSSRLSSLRRQFREDGKKTGETEAVYKLELPGSEIIWLKDQAGIVPFEKDNICISIGTLTIVTKEMMAEEARIAAEKALTESERRYRALFEESNDAVIIHNLKGRIICGNRQAVKLLGYNDSQLETMTMPMLYHESEKDSCNESFENLRKNKSLRFESSFKKADGTVLRVEISARFTDSQNNIIQAILRDVSDRKKLEDRRLKTEKLELVNTLAGGLAHDFNNLLSIILGNISLAQMELKSSSPLHKMLSQIEKAAMHGRSLTRKIINFAEGQEPIKKNASIANLLKRTSSQINLPGNIRIESAIPENLSHVNCDEKQLEQVIGNLIVNAVEAMPNGGTIEIEAENIQVANDPDSHDLILPDGDYVLFSVRDEGHGILGENVTRVFDPYFSTKERGARKGMGLGLSTAYSIIRQHDGNIKVESMPGEGAVFHVTLPVYKKPLYII